MDKAEINYTPELHAADDRELRKGVARWVEYVIRNAAFYEYEMGAHMLGITKDELISASMGIVERGTGGGDE